MRRTTTVARGMRPNRVPLRLYNLPWFCVLWGALGGSVAASADSLDQPVRLDIPANTRLDEALTRWGTETGIQVMMNSETLAAQKTQGEVHGTQSAVRALAALLQNSGFSYTRNDNTVHVVRASAVTAPGNKPPTSADSTKKAPAGVQSTPDAARQSVLEEVIVTAQKRSEKLMDVPSSLTALSAVELQEQGVTNFADYMTLVPSLSDFSGGAQGHGAVILRGLNTGYYQFSNTIGYYIDDIPFSATSPLSYGTFLTLDPDLTDIDHLEVLKGPQATLYGASTLGGLIKVVTKKPDLNSFEGEVRVEGSTVDGGGNGYGVVGIANIPLISGELGLRLSGFERETPGYMRNLTLGTDDRNVSRKDGGRVSLRWEPNEDFSVEVSALLQSLTVNGWNYEFVDLQSLRPLTGPYTYSLQYDPSYHTTYEVYNATVSYAVGSAGTLTNSTSYAKYQDREVEDYSLYYAPYYNAFAPEPVPANAAQPLIFAPSLKKLTEELRFTSQRIGPVEWLGGLFYTDERIGYTNQFLNAIPPSTQPLPGPDGNIGSFDSPADYKEEAAFADLTYYFNNTVDLTAGGRYSHNQQSMTYCQSGFALLNGCTPNSSSDSDFTYLAALRWRVTQDLNTYARIATSYRPGGPQNTPIAGYPTSFKADSLTNYEVGLKGDWVDHKVRANLAVYDMKWKDVQMTSSIDSFPVISNGGKATVRGVELETQLVPADSLSVGINMAYTDAKLDSVSPGVSAITGAVAGDSLPFTPRWSGSVTADYERALNGMLTSTVGLTYRYQGSKWSDYPGDAYNTGVVIPHYNTLDLRAGLRWSRYEAQVRVANLFNEQGLDTVVDQRLLDNPPAFASIIPPRTVTVSFGARF
jgi:iron complex outermembrane receptor protein